MKLLYVSVLFILAAISGVVAISVLLTGFFAFTADESVVAIETLFGSLIAALLFGVLSAKLLHSALIRYKDSK